MARGVSSKPRKPSEFHRVKQCEHCKGDFPQKFARHVFCDDCAPEGKFSKYIRKYGIGKREYDALLIAQDNKCAVCEKVLDRGRDTHVDHDHTTGVIRGLLCNRCNTKIGIVEDEVFMTKANVYLTGCSSVSEQIRVKVT